MPTLLTCEKVTINLDRVTHIEESGSALLVWFGAHHIKLAGPAAQTLRDWIELHALPTAEREIVARLSPLPQQPGATAPPSSPRASGPPLVGKDRSLE
jgi:hypothetical protein